MKTYRVWAKCWHYCYLDVEAESPEEAAEIAADTDGGEFIPGGSLDCGWEVEPNDIEEVRK